MFFFLNTAHLRVQIYSIDNVFAFNGVFFYTVLTLLQSIQKMKKLAISFLNFQHEIKVRKKIKFADLVHYDESLSIDVWSVKYNFAG